MFTRQNKKKMIMKNLFIILTLCIISQPVFSQTYTFDTLVTGIRQPVCFAFFPNGNIIVNQKSDSSKIYNLSTGNLISCFWNFKDSLQANGEAGLLGVCLDPNYSVNRYVYIYYIRYAKSFRVVRFTENNNIGTNPVHIFNDSVGITGFQSNGHYGGNIHFGPGNKLYITIGDHGRDSNSQSLFSFKGKILRINSDGTIPTDNPFYDDGNPKTGNDDRIWALGFRNSYDFTFSPFNDSLYATENGGFANDEINFVRKGKNYGWPICQGFCVPYNPLYRQPMDTIGGNGFENYAPTGIVIYNGNKMPELYGKAIVTGVAEGPVQGLLKCELGNMPFMDTITSHTIISPMHGFSSLRQGPDGYIYALKYRTSDGSVMRLLYSTLGINEPGIPAYYSLHQNFPNPFNPVTTIKYSVPKQDFVTIQIFDMLGREISTLVNESKQAGNYEVIWNADSYPSGVYFYRLTAGDYTEEKKMVLIK
jgi:glucose/arabinose dehydrogenase